MYRVPDPVLAKATDTAVPWTKDGTAVPLSASGASLRSGAAR